MCALLGSVVVGSVGCANVLFERSPHAIRGFDVVYSEQEEMTFLTWRLLGSVDPDQVVFEIWDGRGYQSIDLERAPYPADPYLCGDDDRYLCFQFQFDGEHTWGDEERPLRSVHIEDGIYAGSKPRLQRVPLTFEIDPVAIDNNASIAFQRYDWFALNEVPLKRDYSWQLLSTTRTDYLGGRAEDCGTPDPSAWQGARVTRDETLATPDAEWVEAPTCVTLRAKRERGGEGIAQVVAMPPSAVLYAERQDYIAPEVRPPVIYAYLFDLLIKSDSRCERATRGIVSRIDQSFGERVDAPTPLGIFTPLDTMTGRPLTGCDQSASQDYPFRQIIASLKEAAQEVAPLDVRFVFIYVNNVEIPPSNRILLQLIDFSEQLDAIENVSPYGLAIGSNVVLSLLEWNHRIGWKPIDDDIFIEEMEQWGEYALPFRTSDHDDSTQVRIPLPIGAPSAQRFKICSLTPETQLGVGLPEGQGVWRAMGSHSCGPLSACRTIVSASCPNSSSRFANTTESRWLRSSRCVSGFVPCHFAHLEGSCIRAGCNRARAEWGVGPR